MLNETGFLGPFLESQIAKSKKNECAEISNENLVTPTGSPELGNYESSYPDYTYIEVDDEF